jgi:hypothetical protein
MLMVFRNDEIKQFLIGSNGGFRHVLDPFWREPLRFAVRFEDSVIHMRLEVGFLALVFATSLAIGFPAALLIGWILYGF